VLFELFILRNSKNIIIIKNIFKNEKNVAEVAALNGHRELSEFIEKRINNKLS
jgi:hypothetical protein